MARYRVLGVVPVTMVALVGIARAQVEPLAAPSVAVADAGVPLDTPAQALGYALGYRIGGRILADHKTLDMPIDNAALARGIADAVLGAAPKLPESRFRSTLAEFEAAMQRRQQEFAQRMAAAAKVNLDKGREFLAQNGTRKGVVTLPSGLQYEVLKEGAGKGPAADDIVVAHYRGTHIDGTEFDGTDPQGEPASFPLRGVVPGWQEALPLMKPGAKWRIYLPPTLGYGEEGSPPAIEPNEVLVFEIDLIRSQPAGRP
jgi:FKBP-type peptidyl-prolyl cis-trans isomerase FklB